MTFSKRFSILIILAASLLIWNHFYHTNEGFMVSINLVDLEGVLDADSLGLRNENEFENPEKRLAYEYNMLVDPTTGRIPKGIHLKELDFYKKLVTADGRDNLRSSMAGQQGSSASQFVSRGPFNIGGRTRALALDIANEDVILAGGVSGGMWRSLNAGATWTRTSTVNQLPAVSALVQDKRAGQTNNWYYAAGEFFGNSASATGAFYFGDGIYHSSNNGLTWQLIAATSQGNNVNLGDFGIVNEVVIDNSNTSEREMYAATLSQIIRTTDDFETFSVVLGANNIGFGFSDVAITTTGLLIATIANNVNNGQNAQEGIYKSSNGVTWVNINPPNGLATSYSRIEIAFDPQNEDVFYALGPSFLLQHTISTGEWVTLTANLNVSTDSGQGHNAQGGYNLIAAVHPADSTVVFAGGTNLLRSTAAFTTSASRNNIGGYAEDNNSSRFPTYPNHHPDQHALAFYPSDANKMLSGSDGGVHRTTNNLAEGSTNPVAWQSLNNGYLTSQLYAIDYYPFNRGDDLLVGGMQDNGTWASTSKTADFTWQNLLGGDGSFNAITYNSIYVSAQEGQMRRFELNEAGTGYNFQGDISPSANDSEFLFVNPFIYDPVFQDRLYVGAKGKVFYTNNIRTNPSAGDWLTIPIEGASSFDFTSALAASIQPEGVLYFGTRTGKIFKVADIDESAVAVDITKSNLPSGTVSSIAIDPRDAERVFITYSNYGIVSIWSSENGGQSWDSIAGNLEENSNGTGNGPSIRYFSILPNGQNDALYFVGTSLGMYKTELLDGDNTVWSQEGADVIGSSIVSMIKVNYTEGNVVAATHGNGVFQANYDVVLNPSINYTVDLPNQTALLRGPISFTAGEGFAYQWLKEGQAMSGANSSELTATEPGLYQLRVTDELGPVALSNIINLSLDKTAPILNSIVRFSPTQAQVEVSQVTFRLTFDEDVQGLTSTSFSVSGAVSGEISAVSVVSANSIYDVNVNGIQGTGLLALTVNDASGISDQFGNAFAGTILTSETYTIIDQTAPSSSISRSNPAVEETNRNQLVFSILFDEPVVEVDASDFNLSSNSVSASILGVESSSSSSYLVTIGGFSQDGLVDLDFSANQNITDVEGNAFAANVTSEETFTLNAELAPSLAIQRSAPSIEVVNQSQVTFILTFSEDVVNVEITDFELVTNTTGGTTTTLTEESASSYLLSVSGLTANGTIDVNVVSSNNIETPVGHIFTGVISSEETYTFDSSAGPDASINRSSPTDEVTNLSEVTFEVAFSSPVGNVDLSDFELSATSVGATFGSISALSTSIYLVSLIAIEEDGSLGLSIKSTNNIEDGNGNRFNGGIEPNQTYTILDLVTSIDDPFFKDLTIQLMENPSSGVFEIVLSKEIAKPFRYEVISLGGEVLLSDQRPFYNNNDKIRIDLKSFSDGLYIFKLAIGQGMITSKLLKKSK
ncbi:MAG: hypothetical protein ACJAXX_002088 [Roseivirga sp.]|jgi:hypothetical protein